ncbi:MFS family permease [Peribacillus deserti]|uniref:MFS family permease n=1 Tax=Peribacillus deserti TaxID=673318 RepID=A0ABS2QCR8_9BACI|nr:MFS transporter [Peribacillus deserti]MBM7690825.1 MFS family permease [Peribacillus deserti]
MFSIFKSFSTELKFYLIMNTFFSFGNALSGVFLSVFLWKLDKSYSLLANYSLYWSISIIFSFGLCAWLARKTSPMITMRYGFVSYLITYVIMLSFHESLDQHIILLGAGMGLSISLYSVGMHMAILDLTTNDKREQFLYIEGILSTIGGVIAPLLSGILISNFHGMAGYYVVFIATCVFFVLSFVFSLKVKGKHIPAKSYFWEVIKNPSPEWKKMYVIMVGDGIVSGVYFTFLISMITYKVAGGELNLGIYNTITQIVSIIAFAILAKYSKPEYRIAIFGIGAVSLLLSSVFLSVYPVLIGLIIFGLMEPIASNMIITTMNAMIYASIEKDPQYKEKRLDYIIIREIPLGLGRILGVVLFLWMRKYFDFDQLLPVSFSLFPIVFVLMVPLLFIVWKKSGHMHQNVNIPKG